MIIAYSIDKFTHSISCFSCFYF